MSGEAMNWVWQQTGLTSSAKLVLLRLCHFANGDAECWPSQGRIAADCELSRESVNRAIKQLSAKGLIEVTAQNENGAKIVSHYSIRCDVRSHACDVGSHPPHVTSDHINNLPLEAQLPPPIVPPHEFDVWYAVYPHKVAKGHARTAFKTARRKASLQTLIEGVERYVANKAPDCPWCNPGTWLNRERWLDQPAMLFPAGVEVKPSASRAPPPPMDPKKLGHSLPCHCANCLRWVEEASHAAA